jgi:hypothetical protein
MGALRRWLVKFWVAAALLALIVPTVAASDPRQHHDPLHRFERQDSQLAVVGNPSKLVTDNFEVLGQVNLGGGAAHGDVFFYDHGA